jgi:hypothetical protein
VQWNLFLCKSTLHVSGGTHAHHQELNFNCINIKYVFWEVASTICNMFTSRFRKLGCQNVAFCISSKHIIGIITKWNAWRISVHDNGMLLGNTQWEVGMQGIEQLRLPVTILVVTLLWFSYRRACSNTRVMVAWPLNAISYM